MRVFCITGCGKYLVQEVLDNGDILVATARKPEIISFERTTPKYYHAVKLDDIDPSDIQSAFATALDKFDHVDMVVSNAGYGLSGPCAELSDSQIRTKTEVNLFGLINITRKVMEVMRDQKPSAPPIFPHSQ